MLCPVAASFLWAKKDAYGSKGGIVAVEAVHPADTMGYIYIFAPRKFMRHPIHRATPSSEKKIYPRA